MHRELSGLTVGCSTHGIERNHHDGHHALSVAHRPRHGSLSETSPWCVEFVSLLTAIDSDGSVTLTYGSDKVKY